MLKYFIVHAVAILLLSGILKAQQQSGSVLENRITLNHKNQPLNVILDQISWQARIYFAYDASLVDGAKKYSVDVTDKSLYNILIQLFNPNDYKFQELENQVIISRKIDSKLPVKVPPDSIPVRYFFLKGKIIDSKKEEPVVYASVSVLNKPIGTISNTEGNFLLKIHPDQIRDTVVISCVGYSQIIMPAWKILDEDIIIMKPVSIRIKEIKVVSTTPEKLLELVRQHIPDNYSNYSKLLPGFYRETVKQDGNYISVSEAVVELLKAPYNTKTRSDMVRIIKGRRSPEVKPFQWLNFKLQGGPFTMSQIDVVKTIETFIDPEYQQMYNYHITNNIWYNENPVYVLEFKPIPSFESDGFAGEIYVHRETFAIVHVRFSFTKKGLTRAEEVMIKKKPQWVKAKLAGTDYLVNYQFYDGKWHLANLKSSLNFKVRSRKDRINSEYVSVCDLLITDIKNTELKKFERDETFTQRDIFVEMIGRYDPAFWENYNIISPEEDLENAFKTKDLK